MCGEGSIESPFMVDSDNERYTALSESTRTKTSFHPLSSSPEPSPRSAAVRKGQRASRCDRRVMGSREKRERATLDKVSEDLRHQPAITPRPGSPVARTLVEHKGRQLPVGSPHVVDEVTARFNTFDGVGVSVEPSSPIWDRRSFLGGTASPDQFEDFAHIHQELERGAEEAAMEDGGDWE